jgi:hypothetical protein
MFHRDSHTIGENFIVSTFLVSNSIHREIIVQNEQKSIISLSFRTGIVATKANNPFLILILISLNYNNLSLPLLTFIRHMHNVFRRIKGKVAFKVLKIPNQIEC